MTRPKKTKKQYIKLLTQYGIHIWAILIIANAVMVYAYQISTHAEGKSPSNIHALVVSPSPSTIPSISLSQSPSALTSISPAPSGPPVGPVINLTFTVPGIGSGGGVMNPIHPKRNVIVYLFSPNVNSLNPTVKPLYTIQTSALFDSNPYSPTYTSFLNPSIDLGSDVTNGNYQIAFKTDLSLRTLIKQNSTDLGGEVFSLNTGSPATIIPVQTILMGALVANQDDNVININDYNAFVSCYGDLNNTNSFCKTGNYGDFNDDGVINGIDYNILLRSIYALSQEGIPVPELSPKPSPVKQQLNLNPGITTHPTAGSNPTVTPRIKKHTVGSAFFVIVLLLFFLLLVFGVLLLLYFINPNFHNKINSIIHLSPSGEPSTDVTESTGEEGESVEPEETIESEQQPEPETEVPTQTDNVTETAPQSTSSQPNSDTVEKDCYVKTKGQDEAGTGMWLLLTDDNGAVNAHYNKNNITDGFAKVKGIMKEENGKKYLEISELTTEG